MKTIKDFLTEYANKFPEKIHNKKAFINKTTEISFDYADGLISFYYYENNKRESLVITGDGGNNGYMLKEPEYEFIWDALLKREPKFMAFLKNHNLQHEDLMAIFVSWYDVYEEIGKQEINCNFSFYEDLED